MVFGKNSPTPFSANSSNITFIAEDCKITGTININGNARIDGQVEGNILANGDISIGSTANLNANIEAKTVSIAGKVQGDVKTTEYLELGPSARLYGDIYTKQLKIEQGAIFTGTSHQSSEIAQSPDNTIPETEIKSENSNQEMDDGTYKNAKKDRKR